uniref:Uncharacterized protein n=1 Tax=Acrobeloides nanus TaxID=290746 RepID=A0A914CQ96_9BILA
MKTNLGHVLDVTPRQSSIRQFDQHVQPAIAVVRSCGFVRAQGGRKLWCSGSCLEIQLSASVLNCEGRVVFARHPEVEHIDFLKLADFYTINGNVPRLHVAMQVADAVQVLERFQALDSDSSVDTEVLQDDQD